MLLLTVIPVWHILWSTLKTDCCHHAKFVLSFGTAYLCNDNMWCHYSDVIMSSMTFRFTGVSIVYSTVCSDADQRKHHSSTLLALVTGIHQWRVNSLHKEPVTREIFPFDDIIMTTSDDRVGMMTTRGFQCTVLLLYRFPSETRIALKFWEI